MGKKGATAIGFALLVATFLMNVWYLLGCGEGLSPYADRYSEANALRAGERFAKEGFGVNAGLPDVAYGGRYPGVGIRGSSGSDENDTVYHGYPPGSDWLAGVYIKAFGVEHVSRFRWVPVAFGMFAATVFLATLWMTLGPARALLIYLACLLTPMFTNMTHGLYYHGYAQSLLLLELSILLHAYRRPDGFKPRWIAPVAVGVVGFMQGWFSFDYSFVVTFAAIPMAILLSRGRGDSIAWRKAFWLVLAAGLGFTTAHALHFLQSVLYFGSLKGAINEYVFRSNKIYGLSRSPSAATISKLELTAEVLRLYAITYVRWTKICSPTSIVLLGATGMVMVLRRLSFTTRGGGHRADLTFRPRWIDVLGLSAALLVSLGWVFAKPFHALNHATFNGRHLFLFFFMSCLFVAVATTAKVEGAADVGPRDDEAETVEASTHVEETAAAD